MNHLIHLQQLKHEGEKGMAQRPHSEREAVVPGTRVRALPLETLDLETTAS